MRRLVPLMALLATFWVAGCGKEQPASVLCVDQCGDGQCQEMVCLGEGCPCAETTDNCPQDCGPGMP